MAKRGSSERWTGYYATMPAKVLSTGKTPHGHTYTILEPRAALGSCPLMACVRGAGHRRGSRTSAS